MTDLMLSLALVFMLILAASMLKVSNGSKVIKGMLLNQLKTELAKFDIETIDGSKGKEFGLDDDPLSLIVIIKDKSGNNNSGEQLTFATGSSSLTENARSLLSQMSNTVLPIFTKPKVYKNIDSLRFEGYTDDAPYTTLLGNNRQLSQERALSVLNDIYELVKENPIYKEFLEEKASILGRGDIDKYLIRKIGFDNVEKFINHIDHQKHLYIFEENFSKKAPFLVVDKTSSRRVVIKIKLKSNTESLLDCVTAV